MFKQVSKSDNFLTLKVATTILEFKNEERLTFDELKLRITDLTNRSNEQALKNDQLEKFTKELRE